MKDLDFFHKFYINRQKADLFSWPLSCLVFLVSFITLTLGCAYENYNLALWGAGIFWLYNTAYGFADLWDRFNFLIMNLMLFVFILSRPVIAALYNKMWWYWSSTTIKKVLLIALMGEAFMFIGSKLIYDLPPVKNLNCEKQNSPQKISALRGALLILLIFSSIPAAYAQAKTYLVLRYIGYEFLYTGYAPSMPFIISTFNSIFPYAVFGYLATMPNKKAAVLTLLLYIAMGVPVFLLGNRSSIVVRIAFATTYFLIRNNMEKDGKWVTTRIKIFFTIFVVLSIAFLGTMNYTRSDQNISDSTSMPIVMDFFYRQGTTFDTVCEGVEYEKTLDSLPPATSYTLGNLIDNARFNRIGRFFFNTKDLPAGNSIEAVEKSNSLAHRLSYVVFGEAYYLEGHGRGSSYLLETYLDGEFILLIIFNILLGAFLAATTRIIKTGNFLLNFFVISATANLFLLPRAQSTSFLSFIMSLPFWLVVAYTFAAARFANLKSKDEGGSAMSSLGIRTSIK